MEVFCCAYFNQCFNGKYYWFFRLRLSDNIGRFIAKIWIWDWGKETFTSISTFIGAIVIIAIGLILYKHIIMALSAPFMSPVSEKIEAHLIGHKNHHIEIPLSMNNYGEVFELM